MAPDLSWHVAGQLSPARFLVTCCRAVSMTPTMRSASSIGWPRQYRIPLERRVTAVRLCSTDDRVGCNRRDFHCHRLPATEQTLVPDQRQRQDRATSPRSHVVALTVSPNQWSNVPTMQFPSSPTPSVLDTSWCGSTAVRPAARNSAQRRGHTGILQLLGFSVNSSFEARSRAACTKSLARPLLMASTQEQRSL